MLEHVPLAPRTTLGLGGSARYFASAASDAEIVEAVRYANARGLRLTILGSGSNLVVADDGFDGLVLAIATRGIALAARGASVELRAEAGEPWDALVAHCVARDLAGFECLSGIPGLVGATPIQNVGAYGQEVADTITAVRVLDRKSLSVRTLEPSECGFGYRTSAFKREPERCIVLSVSFALRSGGEPTLRYAELANALPADPSLADVRGAVLALRRQKSMLLEPDENRHSAGSFFMNPIVSSEFAEQLAQRLASEGAIATPAALPRFATDDGRVKLPAAWLIERAGFYKGMRRGAVGISSRHALALVHHGGGTTRELLAFAREIRERVRERFGVELVPEPVLLGFTF